ncbi:hypothetical protein MMC17_004776 [Xylographa soralifera]|nr:hypothetical protein [Xylographa soralifera]
MEIVPRIRHGIAAEIGTPSRLTLDLVAAGSCEPRPGDLHAGSGKSVVDGIGARLQQLPPERHLSRLTDLRCSFSGCFAIRFPCALRDTGRGPWKEGNLLHAKAAASPALESTCLSTPPYQSSPPMAYVIGVMNVLHQELPLGNSSFETASTTSIMPRRKI